MDKIISKESIIEFGSVDTRYVFAWTIQTMYATLARRKIDRIECLTVFRIDSIR